MDRKTYDGALAYANELRAEKGLPPLERLPKGHPRTAGSCPMAEATNRVFGGSFHYSKPLRKAAFNSGVEHPPVVRKFIREFDKVMPDNPTHLAFDPASLVPEYADSVIVAEKVAEPKPEAVTV